MIRRKKAHMSRSTKQFIASLYDTIHRCSWDKSRSWPLNLVKQFHGLIKAIGEQTGQDNWLQSLNGTLVFMSCNYKYLTDPAEVASTLQWRHNERDSVSHHQPHNCLLNRLIRRRSKKTSKLRVTGLCAGSSPGTGEFPAQMASCAENVSIWWRHHGWGSKGLHHGYTGNTQTWGTVA